MILIELSEEWNFIGGLTGAWEFSPAHVSDPNQILVPGTLYQSNYGYSNSSYLNPGEGYWIRTNSAGMISIHEAIAREGGELSGRYNDVEIDDAMAQELIDAGADLRKV